MVRLPATHPARENPEQEVAPLTRPCGDSGEFDQQLPMLKLMTGEHQHAEASGLNSGIFGGRLLQLFLHTPQRLIGLVQSGLKRRDLLF